jgi:hypothetical protein
MECSYLVGPVLALCTCDSIDCITLLWKRLLKIDPIPERATSRSTGTDTDTLLTVTAAYPSALISFPLRCNTYDGEEMGTSLMTLENVIRMMRPIELTDQSFSYLTASIEN